MLHVQTLVVGQLQTNCYIVSENKSGTAIIIDPGDDATYIGDTIVSQKITPTAIYATHGHFDHILAAFELQHMFDIPFFVCPKDEFLLSRMQASASHFLHMPVIEPPPTVSKELQQYSSFLCGTYQFEIRMSPGHTPGGVFFYNKKTDICFTGDTVFAGGAVGEWRHEYSDKTILMQSVSSILSLPPQTTLYPGHGESTTVQSLHL
jgi:glyoxylase-like metal-dependent hydrolase (beta-lactamase superfamily II)